VTNDRAPRQMTDLETNGTTRADGSCWSGLMGLAGLVACGIAFFVIVQMIGPERLRDAVAAAGPLAPVVFVLLKALTIVVTPLSGTPLRLAAGALFGFWEGVGLSVLGGVLGGSANFWIARQYGRRVVARLLGPSALARVEPMLGRLSNWRALALARLVLAPLWDVLSYGVGLTRLRFTTYLAVAILGDIIPSMILVGVGTSVAEIGVLQSGAVGAQAVEMALPAVLVVVAAGLATALLLIVAVMLRPRLARRMAQPALRPTIVPSLPRPSEEGGEISRLAS
jgi:uncharacterized membrane protein YdjX (TVP38/TMEM64 family)